MSTTRPAIVDDRRGAVLILVLLFTLLLMVATAGAFTRVATERRVALDATAQVDAFALAQSGIDRYLIENTSVPTTIPDSASYNLPGGTATVTLRWLRRSAAIPADTIMLITSRAEAIGNRYNASAPGATRTVSQMIRFAPGLLDVDAGFYSFSGFLKNGNSGSLSGVDRCGMNPDIAGIAVPSVPGDPSTAHYSGHTNPINGNPDNTPVILGTPGPTGTAKDALSFDWKAISQRTGITPDYYQRTVSPTVSWQPSAPPSSGSAWNIIFVEGDYTGKFPGNGKGLFIVTGNLTMNGNTTWEGIVLVGGHFTSNGNNTVYGATYVGLNAIIPEYNPPNVALAAFPVPGIQDVGNGTKTYQYDSCAIKNALEQFGDWNRLGNAWTDNWPSY